MTGQRLNFHVTHPVLDRAMAYADGLRRVAGNFFLAGNMECSNSQQQTGEAFSRKWEGVGIGSPEYASVEGYQKEWFLRLYGFADERELAECLQQYSLIIDCGSGLGYKSAWFAELAPGALVIGIDYSEAAEVAATYYRGVHENLAFIRGDIGSMPYFPASEFGFVCCDQVIMHTTNPRATFAELARIVAPGGQIACYVYRKKALPRELLDSYFREHASQFSHEEMLDLSRQLTELGRILSRHADEIDFPAVPILGIEAGRQTIQRFIYWNFIKCFWNEQLGERVSVLTNYDWYAPSQAARYTEQEYRAWISSERLHTILFRSEPACFSGRFARK